MRRPEFGAAGRDVVERNAEHARAAFRKRSQLLDERRFVGSGHPVQSGRHDHRDRDARTLPLGNQLGELRESFGRIAVAPIATVQRVVLRGVRKGVETVGPKPANQLDALTQIKRAAVVPLDRSKPAFSVDVDLAIM